MPYHLTHAAGGDLRVSGSGYLTIEEVAQKLGKSPSWVKGQICEGKLGARLAGKRWLISPRDVDELLSSGTPSPEPNNIVHNFLPERPPKKSRGAPKRQKASSPTQRSEATERSKKPSPSGNKERSKEGKGKKPTLTQRIRELDREFGRLSTHLKTAMLEYRAAVESGKKAKLPNNLLREWKTVGSELQHLIRKAHVKGLVLPASLSIYRILGQNAHSIKLNTVTEGNLTHKKPPVTAKGIDGYYAGPGRGDSQKAKRVPADAEARLIILRTRERAAARSMQDRGTSHAARDAAAASWAQARREAEKVERELQAARRQVQEVETKSTTATDRPDSSKATNGASTRSPRVPSSPPSSAFSTFAVRPASKGKRLDPPHNAASDYQGETAHQISLGNYAPGVVLVVEQPVGPRILEALKLSLRAVGLPEAHVIHTSTGLLAEELLATEPDALIAIGAGAARDIDAAGYPLVLCPFSEAETGVWFLWTRDTSGLLLPSLAPALDDEAAKRRFWRTFLSLKALAPGP